MPQKSTLVYHAGALGDFITILPVLRAWRRENPESSIVLLTRAAHGELARAAGYADEVWDIARARYSYLFVEDPELAILNSVSRFDTAIAFAAADSPVLRNMARSGIPRILHQPPFPSDWQHVVDYHLSLLPPAMVRRDDRAPLLKFGDEEEDGSAARLRSRTVILHPGSGSERKNWPVDRFSAVAKELQRKGLETVWLAGFADEAIVVPGGQRTVREPSLVELARLLRNARLFIGNDSGVSHLAGAVGASCVVLFGPSSADSWSPRGPGVTVIRAPRRDCHPCHPTGFGPVPCENPCIADITVDEVLAAAAKAAGLAGPKS